MGTKEHDIRESPELKAGLLSKIFVWWIVPFLRKGAKKELNLEDVYHALPEHCSETLGAKVEEAWNQEQACAGMQGRPPKMWKVIARLIWRKYLLMGLGHGFDELVIRTIQLISLRNLIRTFSVENPEDHENLRWDQFIYACLLVLFSFFHAIFRQNLIGFMDHVGIEIRVGLSALVYRKMLRLRHSDSEQTNIGKLTNILAVDVGRIDENFHLFNFFYIAPVQLTLCSYLLWKELGVACFGGLGSFVIILPCLMLISRLTVYFRMRIGKRTDERGRFLNEIIGGIRLIKMYAWEKPFAEKISKLREAEINFVRKSLYFKGMHISVHTIAAKFIPFCALILYVALGNTLTADKAFFSIAVFNAISQAVMSRISIATSQMGELIAACNRIEDFMLSKENKERCKVKCNKDNHGNFKNKMITDDGQAELEAKIIMQNYSASWTEQMTTLKKLNVNLRGNQLVMVVGHVGSGKSSFLNAILSELPITSGDDSPADLSYCHIQGEISYASQETWIFPASVRQNILFGLDMDEERYWRVVDMCCLSDDFKLFPRGDLTFVGERGITLSGGQKARVNLARAIYQKADIYLLDDPLSAVDTKVSKLLFNECIKGHLERKLRILVTHQLQYLPMADHVIVFNREGEIWGQGTYEELRNSVIDFTSLISNEYMKSQVENVDEFHEEKLETDPDEQEKVESFGIRRRKHKSKEQIGNGKVVDGESIHAENKDEKKSVGSRGIGIYLSYFKSGGSYLTVFLLMMGYITTQVLSYSTDFWLLKWTNAVTTNEDDGIDKNLNLEDGQVDQKSQTFYAYVYSALMAVFMFTTVFRSYIFFRYCMRISINLHDGMFKSLVRAPTKFFDDNPSGRIMNRFTKDLNQIDEKLPVGFYDFIHIFLTLLSVLAINVCANYYIAIPAVIMVTSLWNVRGFYLKSSVNLRRIEALAKSPMFTHVTMTVQGLTTIRALKAEKRMLNQFEDIQDTHTGVYYVISTASRWFVIWIEMLTVAFLACVSFGFLILATSAQGGNVGVAISAILSLAGGLQWGMRKSAETENYMTSVERALEYSNLKAEAPLESPGDDKLMGNWPTNGDLAFQDVSLAYDDGNENQVLKKISFSISSNEKIGIVGRTGAGKSSLITALFRLTEPCNGTITIDGVSVETVGLHTLRSRISIIPQDPVLFTGTLRYNLDPFGEFEDERLWSALKDVDLFGAVSDLDCPVADGGSNFSVGQRQLVCLARAILRKNKTLVLDEATANVDPVTDQLVQQTIKTKFLDCTILTIAHRLQTVLDSDKIMVLDAGRIVDFDCPDALLKNDSGAFYAMFHQSNQNGHNNS